MKKDFVDLDDLEWSIFGTILSRSKKNSSEYSDLEAKHAANTILYILITGCSWEELPEGPAWVDKIVAHQWFSRWKYSRMFL